MKTIKSRKREPIPQILTWNHPVLSEVCKPVKSPENIPLIVRGMIQAMTRTKIGVGLAAPQIGILQRIIVIAPNGFPKAMINPEIVESSVHTNTAKEGCLSYPGKYVMVERPNLIYVTYRDWKWNLIEREMFTDFAARIICHEVDHLDGICKVGKG